ncbi:MAG: zf-HC2 domain-containing protein [Planctomycetota bacterium]|nr:MAG: zf-HC2 domain-containing protein [Planctomycetota bacterium]
MNCERVDLLLGWIEDALDEGERRTVLAHLEECTSCTETVEAYREARDALQDLPVPRPSEEARARAYAAVLAAMEKDAAAPDAATDDAPRGTGGGDAARTRGDTPRGAGEGAAGGPILPWLRFVAAAAVLLLVASLWGAFRGEPGQAETASRAPAPADRAAEEERQRVEEARAAERSAPAPGEPAPRPAAPVPPAAPPAQDAALAAKTEDAEREEGTAPARRATAGRLADRSGQRARHHVPGDRSAEPPAEAKAREDDEIRDSALDQAPERALLARRLRALERQRARAKGESGDAPSGSLAGADQAGTEGGAVGRGRAEPEADLRADAEAGAVPPAGASGATPRASAPSARREQGKAAGPGGAPGPLGGEDAGEADDGLFAEEAFGAAAKEGQALEPPHARRGDGAGWIVEGPGRRRLYRLRAGRVLYVDLPPRAPDPSGLREPPLRAPRVLPAGPAASAGASGPFREADGRRDPEVARDLYALLSAELRALRRTGRGVGAAAPEARKKGPAPAAPRARTPKDRRAGAATPLVALRRDRLAALLRALGEELPPPGGADAEAALSALAERALRLERRRAAEQERRTAPATAR